MSNLAIDYTKTCGSNNSLSKEYTAIVYSFTANELVDTNSMRQSVFPMRKPVWGMMINNQYYKFSKPIALLVYNQGQYFFAENDTLNICGEGCNVDMAISDALNHIQYFYNYYLSLSDDKVTSNALEIKKIYNSLI